MTWAELFERAAAHAVDEAAVLDALEARRGSADGKERDDDGATAGADGSRQGADGS